MPKILYDITPTISEQLAVFPGDVRFKHHITREFGEFCYLTSSFTHTAHLGAHTDAPKHYSPQGKDIAEANLEIYFGECQVVHIDARSNDYRLLLEHFSKVKIAAPRILIATGSYPDPNLWQNDFMALSVELVEYLASQNVILIGIDTPSVDPAQDSSLHAHHACLAHKITILEGIDLQQVPDGLYQLCALPLKIKHAEASPVRAVLW